MHVISKSPLQQMQNRRVRKLLNTRRKWNKIIKRHCFRLLLGYFVATALHSGFIRSAHPLLPLRLRGHWMTVSLAHSPSQSFQFFDLEQPLSSAELQSSLPLVDFSLLQGASKKAQPAVSVDPSISEESGGMDGSSAQPEEDSLPSAGSLCLVKLWLFCQHHLNYLTASLLLPPWQKRRGHSQNRGPLVALVSSIPSTPVFACRRHHLWPDT